MLSPILIKHASQRIRKILQNLWVFTKCLGSILQVARISTLGVRQDCSAILEVLAVSVVPVVLAALLVLVSLAGVAGVAGVAELAELAELATLAAVGFQKT